ncbi:MAG: response regulator [Pseudomonadota bacterium]
MSSGKRILVVDDEPRNLVVLSALVKSLGHFPETVNDGPKALEMISPDTALVLLDVMMPGMDGFEVAGRIRDLADVGDIPIIMVTALTSKEDRLRAAAAGANDFISKPVDKTELQIRMASLLRMKEAQDAVKRHRAELETIVQKRTAALVESEQRVRQLYAESKVREELYSSVLNSSADAVLVTDIQGVTQYISPSFTEMFGWNTYEANGTCIPFVPRSALECTEAMIHGIIRDGRPVVGFETRRLTKDGTERDISVSASVYHDHLGKPEGLVFILRDITAFKVLERARARAVHHVSHELATPLAVVRAAFSRLLDDDLSAEARPAVMRRIERNLDRLRNIQTTVGEIVTPRPYNPRPMEVLPTISAIVDDIRAHSRHRAVTVEPAVQADQTDIIDPLALRKIIWTLTKNAIENTPDEGKVWISVGNTNDGICLQVRDCGVGIAPEDERFIFEPFHHTQQTDQYSTRSYFDFNAGGKGLELMHLKIMSDTGAFAVSFKSRRCRHIQENGHVCPGRISSCGYVGGIDDCVQSGGTTFAAVFSRPRPRP